jgi:transcriptional regulator with XRE-family HTH domain
MTFGDMVRSLRAEKQWSQEELARQAGVSQPVIAGIEDGTTKPQNLRVSTVAGLAKAFAVSAESLMRVAGLAPEPPAGIEEVIGAADARRLENSWPFLTRVERLGILAQIETIARERQREQDEANETDPDMPQFIYKRPFPLKIPDGK